MRNTIFFMLSYKYTLELLLVFLILWDEGVV